MLNNEFPPMGGGTASVNHALLKELSTYRDFECDLVTSSPDTSFQKVHFTDRITVHRLPVGTSNLHHATLVNLVRYSWNAWRYARELQTALPYDIVMAWSTVPAGAVAWLFQREFGTPYVVRVTGPDLPGFEDRYRVLHLFLKPVLCRVWRGARSVIVKCAEEAQMLENVCSGAALTEIPNGVDSDYFEDRSVRIPGKAAHILCVARLVRRKGQPVLLEAVRRLLDRNFPVTLTLVGDGDEEDEYRQVAARLDIGHIVTFSGYVDRDNIKRFYHAADIFVLPSENEGMSVAMLEALACGLPTVITEVGGLEHVREAVITFPRGDVQALENLLIALITNPDEMRRRAALSRAAALRLSWSAAARALNGVIENSIQ